MQRQWQSYLIFLLINIVGIAESSSVSCGNGWIKGPYGSCYKFVVSPAADWKTAQGLCRDMRGYLATLETEEEIIWMHGYRAYHGGVFSDSSWIGGYKRDGKFYWSERLADSPILVAAWAPGEPNNVGGNQNCVSLYGQYYGATVRVKSAFKFDDAACDRKYSYICEKPIIVTTK